MLPVWRKRLTTLCDLISFSPSVRSLVEVLNREIDSPERVKERVNSHPSGFVRSISKRRLSIAECYLTLTTSRKKRDYPMRLRALEQLVYHAFHAKTLAMPLNTARVQVALMKRCVGSSGNRRRQLEHMSDFSDASYGKESVIRRLLKALELVEVPEDGRSLKDMGLGWDGHVHDALSQGRKNPTELLVDAFIKGLSHITLVYYHLDPDLTEETLKAGRILGVDVEIGIEFSVGRAGERVHLMYVPPQDGTASSLRKLVEEHQDVFLPFEEKLEANAQQRRRCVQELVDHFNNNELPHLNERFSTVPPLQIPLISWDDLAQVHGEQVARIHFGMALAERIRPILHKRVLYLKNQYCHALHRLRRKTLSSWEVDHLRSEYENARQEYMDCSPFHMNNRFASRSGHQDYHSAFSCVEDLEPILDHLGGQLAFIHPLSVGARRAARVLIDYHRLLTGVEVFNMSDSMSRDPADIRRLDRLIGRLGEGDPEAILQLLESWNIQGIRREEVEAACGTYAQAPLNPRVGSDYVGSEVKVPGIGFIDSRQLTSAELKRLRQAGHPALPVSLGHHVLRFRDPAGDSPPPEVRVYALSPPKEPPPNLVGDEVNWEPMGLGRFWTFLNPNLKELAKVLAGLLPAWHFVGPFYALLWLGITATRNIMADLIAVSGFDLRAWALDNINRTNLANSLFWTGFSVPVLGLAMQGYGWLWTGYLSEQVAAGSMAETFFRFLVLSVTNGLYISTHNRIRGFGKTVIRANFFRSVLAWPLAALGSYGLSPMGVPSIVQTKIWSDVVGGLIEGTSKFVMRLRLRQRDLMEMFAQLKSAPWDLRYLVMADILFVWAKRDRGASALATLLNGSRILPGSTRPGNTRFGRTGSEEMRGKVGSTPNQDLVQMAYPVLKEHFHADGNVEAMTAAVLNHYSGEEATVLTSFIGEHHDAFAQWLLKHPVQTQISACDSTASSA